MGMHSLGRDKTWAGAGGGVKVSCRAPEANIMLHVLECISIYVAHKVVLVAAARSAEKSECSKKQNTGP